MKPEVEVYLHILMVVGICISAPFLFRVFFAFGKYLVGVFYQKTTVNLRVTNSDGNTYYKTIKLSDDEELVKAMLALSKREVQ
ncbi:hypothetical protein VB891_002297 [Vibrio cholerae]|nr:hypothetical protein [Vibrio cholerae]